MSEFELACAEYDISLADAATMDFEQRMEVVEIYRMQTNAYYDDSHERAAWEDSLTEGQIDRWL